MKRNLKGRATRPADVHPDSEVPASGRLAIWRWHVASVMGAKLRLLRGRMQGHSDSIRSGRVVGWNEGPIARDPKSHRDLDGTSGAAGLVPLDEAPGIGFEMARRRARR